MAKFCSSCGAELKDAAKFCAVCGMKNEIPDSDGQEQTESVMPIVEQPPPAPAVQPVQTDVRTAKPMSSAKYWINIFFMSLPLIGLIISILLSIKKEPSNSRNLARAMIFFSVVSIVVCVIMAVLLYIYTQTIEGLHFTIFGIKLF